MGTERNDTLTPLKDRIKQAWDRHYASEEMVFFNKEVKGDHRVERWNGFSHVPKEKEFSMV